MMMSNGMLGQPARLYFQGQYGQEQQGLRLLDAYLYIHKESYEVARRLLAYLELGRYHENIDAHLIYGELAGDWTIDATVYSLQDYFNYMVVLSTEYIAGTQDLKRVLTLQALHDLRMTLRKQLIEEENTAC
ncbi:hypothetical protein KSC_007390 [Ktedonobacter sp. SOSP1-52]|uniref:hypothetical protein n=1 Tax=Ktedonobacter sp. SOSP1-52 TaxID=2778366 RepID=UPI0019151AE2|nr:hypothetical protein [Ktedonobacter sp. SOSP1-52]GHO61847.1 hypothetical protein KSC_007390 [Ktedonobacter sp. SOSP1-52]